MKFSYQLKKKKKQNGGDGGWEDLKKTWNGKKSENIYQSVNDGFF